MGEIILGTVVFTGLIMALAFAVLGARAVIWGRGRARIAVNDDELPFESPLGVKLLAALSQEGINLPTSCGGAGTCGLCRVRVDGAGDTALPIERVTLNARDIKDGYRLACQLVVRGDMQISVPPELLGTGSWMCAVTSTRMLSPLIKEIVFDFPEGEAQEMQAGSYIVVNAPPFRLAFEEIEVAPAHEDAWKRMGLREMKAENESTTSRAYSVVLRPDRRESIILNVRLALPPANNPDAPPGKVSSYLFGLNEGDAVDVTGPFGHFFVRDNDNEIIFIGGGVGMAPLYSHVYDQLETRDTRRRISFWYGARTLGDLYYADEMSLLAAEHDNFTWHPVLSEPAPGDPWDGDTGFVHDTVFDKYLKDHPAPETCEYYLCGPPLMIRAVRAMLDKLGVPKENVLSDDFGV